MNKLKEQLLSYQKTKTFESLMSKAEGEETLKLINKHDEKLLENQKSHQ